jgi:RES domain-containing protein
MRVFRIAHISVVDMLAGSGNESRWCSAGRKVIYMASSIALCCLENLLRRAGQGFSNDFKTIFYEIQDDVKPYEIPLGSLTDSWRTLAGYPDCQAIGNAWYDQPNSLVMRVPSAIIPDESNFVIKTTSTDIKKIQVIEARPFLPDERLERFLRNVV